MRTAPMSPRRWLPALVLFATVATLGGAKADDATRVSIAAVTIPVASPDVSQPHCFMTLGPGYIHYWKRPNGTTYGTWVWTSSMSCGQNMVYMWTLSHMTKLPATNINRGVPGACGTDKLTVVATAGCRNVAMSGGTYYCDPCNGTWELVSQWRVRYPTLVVGKFNSNNTLVCVFHLGAKNLGRLDCTGVSKPLTIPVS